MYHCNIFITLRRFSALFSPFYILNHRCVFERPFAMPFNWIDSIASNCARANSLSAFARLNHDLSRVASARLFCSVRNMHASWICFLSVCEWVLCVMALACDVSVMMMMLIVNRVRRAHRRRVNSGPGALRTGRLCAHVPRRSRQIDNMNSRKYIYWCASQRRERVQR